MDIDLRIILVIVGVLFIVGIIVADQLKRKKNKDLPYRRFSEGEDFDLPSMSTAHEAPDYNELNELRAENEVSLQSMGLVDDVDEVDIADSIPSENSPVESTDKAEPTAETTDKAEPTAETTDTVEPLSERVSEQAPEQPEQHDVVEIKEDNDLVLSLLVLAPKGEIFRGSQIKMALKETSFSYGSMNIFHQMDGDESVVSIANVLEPGTFELDDIASLKTPGLVLFTQLPAIYSGEEMFDRWYRTARKLKAALSGRLTDMHQQPLDKDAIDKLREEAEGFAAINQNPEQD